MFSLSHTTGYAIQALGCLDRSHQRLTLEKEIAEQTGIPKAYLAKVLNSLIAAGLVVSKRGYRGGVALARPAEQISLMEVARAIEGDNFLPECVLGLPDCADLRLCPTYDFWKEERKKIEDRLFSTTVDQVIGAGNGTVGPQETCCQESQFIPLFDI